MVIKMAEKKITEKNFKLPEAIKDKLFVEKNLTEVLDKTEEEITEEFKSYFFMDRFNKLKNAQRFRAALNLYISKHMDEIKSPAEWVVAQIISVGDAKDINEKKRENGEIVPEKYVNNLLGITYDQESGKCVPMTMTLWDNIAKQSEKLKKVNEKYWLKFRASPNKQIDSDEFRVLNSAKTTKFKKANPVYKGETVDLVEPEEAMEKYFTTRQVSEATAEARNRLPAKVQGRIISVKTTPSKKGYYTIDLMDMEVSDSMTEIVLRLITPEEPRYDNGSAVEVFGEPQFSSDQEGNIDENSLIMFNPTYIKPVKGEFVDELEPEDEFEEDDEIESILDGFEDEDIDEDEMFEEDEDEELIDDLEDEFEDEFDDEETPTEQTQTEEDDEEREDNGEIEEFEDENEEVIFEEEEDENEEVIFEEEEDENEEVIFEEEEDKE
jgi:hypothetical protein